MTASKITAEQFSGPLAASLREHREDRTALLASLSASFRADPRIRAAWLWGSFGRAEADDLSDLDPWIIVTDEAAPQMGLSLEQYIQETSNFLSGREYHGNAPPGGGSYGSLHEGRHGLLHVDCYWQPQSALTSLPKHGVLFDRLDEYAKLLLVSPPLAVNELGTAGPVEDGLGFAWLMFSIAAKHLARDPKSDMALLLYPKPGLEDAAARLEHSALLTEADWAVPEEPLEKVERLRHLVRKTEQIRRAAEEQGLLLSPVFSPCLLRYLDLVTGILAEMR